MSGEFLPVTIVPVPELDGRAAEDPLVALALGLRPPGPPRGPGATTPPVLRLEPELLHQELRPLDGLLVGEAHGVFAGIAEDTAG